MIRWYQSYWQGLPIAALITKSPEEKLVNLPALSFSAQALLLISNVPAGAGAKSRLLIGNNFLNVFRFRNPMTLIFPESLASSGFSISVLVLTNVSGLWVITRSACVALPSLT